MSVTLSKSQFRKTGYSEQGPGRRLTVGAELGLSALKTLYLRLAICLLSCLLRILAFTALGRYMRSSEMPYKKIGAASSDDKHEKM
ncbi:hypothetical protein QL285_069863 [Trifolium repens]|nr:hypothetical protein QL285_069863 [Trifolium repens]